MAGIISSCTTTDNRQPWRHGTYGIDETWLHLKVLPLINNADGAWGSGKADQGLITRSADLW